MKHAFILSVHTNFDQIKYLVKSLSFGDVFIHVDKKSESLYEQLNTYYKNSDHVILLNDRINVNWSGFSQVEATIKLLTAVKDCKRKYDYIHFISGQDLLLMNEKELETFIRDNGFKEFIEVENIGNYWWRLKCFSFFRENPKNRTLFYRGLDILLRFIQLPFVRRNNLKKYTLYKGSQWFSITDDCLNYILDTVFHTDYVENFKHCACPDEHFFQIILMNSQFKDRVSRYNGRYIQFDGVNTSPKVLTGNDYEHFMNGQYMFARKFDMKVDEKVILRVLNHLEE